MTMASAAGDDPAETVVNAGAASDRATMPDNGAAKLVGETGADRTGAQVGYARVSTVEQHLDQQITALSEAGCERIFKEKASGTRADRPELAKALDYMRPGDTLVVWRLDRLGRSLRHLVETVAALGDAGVGFRSLHESIDTTTSTGRLVFHIFAALAEFERDLIVDRTQVGLAAAREKGHFGGRPPALTPEQTGLAQALRAAGTSYIEIARLFSVSDRTVRRALSQPRKVREHLPP